MKKKRQNDEDLITVQEAVEVKGVSKARIHQWLKEGRLTKEERYGRVLVHREELLSIGPLPAGRPPKDKK